MATENRGPYVAVSYTHLDVYKRQFIPVFSQVRQAHGRDAAHRMVSSVINATVLLAVAFITIGEFFVGPLTRIVAPGFHGEVYALTAVSYTHLHAIDKAKNGCSEAIAQAIF